MLDSEDALADQRRQIDEIDAEIHDLLMRRTEVVQQIGAIKGKTDNHMRPGREAQVLRRLIARHRGALSKALIVRIWREMFAAVTALQGKLAVAVYAPEGTFGYRNLARDQYGWRTPITAYKSAAQVLEAVTDGRATVGVLPVPRGDEDDPWWRNLARIGDAAPRVVTRLPFAVVDPPRADSPEGLAISLTPAEPTGHDRAYILVETSTVVSRSHLRELLSSAGFEVLDIQVTEEGSEHVLHLVEVEGYAFEHDARLAGLMDMAEGTISQVRSAGGYAVPLSLEEMTSPGRGTPQP